MQVPAIRLKAGSLKTLQPQGWLGKEVLEPCCCENLKKRLKNVLSQQDTQPLSHRTCGLRLWHVPGLQLKPSLTTLTKSRWCFHAECPLWFLLKATAPLLAPC